jgi:hypothetical protein
MDVVINGVRFVREDTLPPRSDDQLLEPPYCQVVGHNAAVLLTRKQIEWLLDLTGGYAYGPGTAGDIYAEMRRAQIALDAAERVEA